LLKFAAPVVEANFAPIYALSVWPGCISSAFAKFFHFFYKELAFSTFFIRQHISPHVNLISSNVVSLKVVFFLVNILQNCFRTTLHRPALHIDNATGLCPGPADRGNVKHRLGDGSPQPIFLTAENAELAELFA